VADTVELLRCLDVPELHAHTQLLAGQPDADGLRALFTTWITLPQPALAQLMPHLLAACVTHIKARGRYARECRTVLQLAEPYPNDAGVLTSLLLNHLVLEPGQAIYLPAGNLHSYLHGTGVEIMANSDNVLRGGLTPKHVDVPELLRVVDFVATDQPVLSGETCGRQTVYRTPMPEFQLSRLDWAAGETEQVALDTGWPQILLSVAGSVLVHAADGRVLSLPRGSAAWLAAGDPPVKVGATGEQTRVFVASTGKVD
jgi:mannose-6-phosphate isomerase